MRDTPCLQMSDNLNDTVYYSDHTCNCVPCLRLPMARQTGVERAKSPVALLFLLPAQGEQEAGFL